MLEAVKSVHEMLT